MGTVGKPMGKIIQSRSYYGLGLPRVLTVLPDYTATAMNKLVPGASPGKASDCLSLSHVSKLWVAMSYEREPFPFVFCIGIWG